MDNVRFPGTGHKQFSNPEQVAPDRQDPIYICELSNNRLVRINDMTGAGWVAIGTDGQGVHQFTFPMGIAVDQKNRLYVVDSGNHRLVGMDDINSTNWVSYDTSGTSQG